MSRLCIATQYSHSTDFFFFQAEDGIRDLTVTGVQTCALPISRHARRRGARNPLPRRAPHRPEDGRVPRPAREPRARGRAERRRSEEHTSELQSQSNLVCRLLLEKYRRLALDRLPAVHFVVAIAEAR